jgi:hypothetical protein
MRTQFFHAGARVIEAHEKRLKVGIMDVMSDVQVKSAWPRRTVPCIEVMDRASAQIMRRLAGPEKIRLACTLGDGLRHMMAHYVPTQHPDWTLEQIRAEVASRVARAGTS